MPSAQKFTGVNHVTEVDRRPGLSRLADDLSILRSFADYPLDLATSVSHMAFMVAGHDEEVDCFIELTRGMSHCDGGATETGLRCVVVAGSVFDWRRAIIEGNKMTPERSSLRVCFNGLYQTFIQKGLGKLFEEFRPVRKGDVMLLEKK